MRTKQLPPELAVANSRVLVVGDVMLDRYMFGDVGRISPEAPVPVVRIVREESRLGGAANVAANARALGARVTLMSVVGRDEAGRLLAEVLEDQGINAHLHEDSSMQTTVKLRVIGRNQQMMRVDFEQEPESELLCSLLQTYEEALSEYDVVVFSDYGKGGLAHISKMIGLARLNEVPTLVDPKGSKWNSYTGADVITPNIAELKLVVGGWSDEADLESRVWSLRRKLQLPSLLLTRSEAGMTFYDEDGPHYVTSTTREVSDVTGAGDTVIATMAVMLAAGVNPIDAMAIANNAAGLVVSKFGTASLTFQELKASVASESLP